MLAAGHGTALWYLTRGSGTVALLLLTASVVLGILEVRRWSAPRWPRFVTAGLHRNVSLLAVAFLGVHIATAIVDGFAPIGWLDAVIPFRSPYRPLWLGLGAVAFDLLLAVALTSLVRTRLGYRAWKAVHWAAYACWPIALLHGMGTGSDTRFGWDALLDVAMLGAVTIAVAWRVAERFDERSAGSDGPVVAAVAAVLVPVAIVVFLLAGPMRPGWSRIAGTPRNLRTGTPAAAGAGAGSGAPAAVGP